MKKKTTDRLMLNYLRKIIAVYCLILNVHCVLAQNPLWTLPSHYLSPSGYNALPSNYSNYFKNTPSNTPPWNNDSYVDLAHAVMPDAQGNPLFYVMDGFVFDKNFNSLGALQYFDSQCSGGGGTGAFSGGKATVTGYSQVLILPDPNNCKQYYVLSSASMGNIISNGSCNHTGGFDDTGEQYCFWSGSPSTSSGIYWGAVPTWFSPFYSIIDVSLIGTTTSPIYSTSKTLYAKDVSCNCTGSSLPVQNTAFSLANLLYSSMPSVRSNGIYYATSNLIAGTPNYRWVFISDGGKIYKLKFTGSYSGNTSAFSLISTFTLPSAALSDDASQPYYDTRAEMELVQKSSGNYELAVPYLKNEGSGNFAYALYVATLNSSADITSPVSSDSIIYNIPAYSSNTPSIHGLEFSPDGNNLYITHDSTSTYPNPIEVINTSTYVKSALSVSHASNFAKSQIETYTDNKLYFANASNLATYDPVASAWNPTAQSITYGLTAPQNAFSGIYSNLNCYLLPTQVDGMNYSNFQEPNTSCCIFYNSYDRFQYSAGTQSGWTNTTQTWSQNTVAGTYQNNPLTLTTSDTVTIGEELRIPAGYVVTINNMKIKFSSQARLIIEGATSTGTHGGKLILSGCTLTVDNRCINDMWPGVQVWGSPTHSQSANNQGYFSATNSIIENAYLGILVGCDTTTWISTITPAPTNPLTPQLNHISYGTGPNYGGGGIAYLYGCTFLNNQRSVVFNTYTNATVYSVIDIPTFNVNSALLGGSSPRYGIGMYGYSGTGLNILGASFTNSYNTFADTGIYTLNSAYTVNKYGVTNPVYSAFNTLQYGIYSQNTSGNTATIKIDYSTFNNNFYGIYLGNIINPIVELDTFKTYATTCIRCSHPKTYGLYLDAGTGYSVRDNYFTRFGVSSTNDIYGIIANNSPNINFIFRNTFSNLYVGNQAQFQNYVYDSIGGYPYNLTGLQYICNTFTNTISGKDIYVPGDNNADTITYHGVYHHRLAGIANQQGANSGTFDPVAGNWFSHTSGGTDFYVDTVTAYSCNYVYNCSAGAGCTSSNYYPLHYRNTSIGYYATNTSCSTINTYTCSGCRTVQTDPLQGMLNQAAFYKATYDSLIIIANKSNASSLLSIVTGNNNPSTVYNSLSNTVPYIVDDILKAYINGNYSASDITQILTACSPLTVEVNKAMLASNLSAGIKSQLTALQTGTSKITQLSAKIGDAFTMRHLLLDEVIRTYMRDSIPANVQKGYELMKVKALELPARTQLETGLAIHDAAMAASALSEVVAQEGQSNYVKISTILLDNLNKTPQQIMQNQSTVTQMLAFATDSTDRFAYLKANILLHAIGKSKYVPYIQQSINTTIGMNTTQPTNGEASIATVVQSTSTLYNSPNPFKESTTIKAVITEKTQNAYIVITDMVGSELAHYPVQQGENNININAGDMAQTVMFCTLVVDGVKIKTNKMVLIR